METRRFRRSGRQWSLVWAGVFIAFIGVLVTISLVFRPIGYYPLYPFYFGWIWIPFAFFILFFVLRWFLWPVGWGYRWGYWTNDAAYQILRERFARGEITREQFEQMTRDLQQIEGSR